MPTYEYRCSDCGNTFEVTQRISDDTLTVCEKCGGKLRKVFHPAGIVFKGSGFYATDSRSKSKSSSSSSKDSSDSKADSKESKDTSDTKTSEKKPEAKKPSSSESSK